MKKCLFLFPFVILLSCCTSAKSSKGEETSNDPRPRMTKLSVDEGQRAYREYVIPLILSLSDANGSGDWSSRYRCLPERPRQLVACAKAFADVPNGGFEQYFRNTFGDSARDAVTGFEWLEYSELAQAVSSAITLLAADPVESAEARHVALQALESAGLDLEAHFHAPTTRFLLGFESGREFRVHLGLAALREGLWP